MEQISYYALMVLAVAFGFSWLVFVHELGHYLLAKWNGVRVHVFSIGMGPYLLSFTKGETLYVISMVPIGGYVKMAGQDDMKPDLSPTKDPRDYRNKRAGQKAAILAAGAIFNLIFAYLGFAACYYFGVEMPAPVIDKVSPQSPAGKAKAYAGTGREMVPNPLKEGDRITMVNGQPIKSFFELAMAVGSAGTDRDIYIQYERPDEFGRLVAAPTPAIVRTERDSTLGAASAGIDQYMEPLSLPLGFEAPDRIVVADVSEDSPASRAGFKAGDVLLRVDGHEVEDHDQVIERVTDSQGKEMALDVMRDGAPLTLRASAEKNAESGRYLLGIRMELAQLVTRIDPTSEAYAKGLREGQWIRAKEYAKQWSEVVVVRHENTAALLARTSSLLKLKIPESAPGGLSAVIRVPMDTEIRAGSMGDALGMAWADTVSHSTMVFVVLHRLITREVAFKNMAGPVGMASILTRVASRRSFSYYLWFLALLSLNLGVLQFVPIPLLDGWHLVMVTVERLKGSPVSLRVQEAFQYVGLFLILFLLVMVTKNDIMRFFN